MTALQDEAKALNAALANALSVLHDRAMGDAQKYGNFLAKFKDKAAGAFNHFDKDDKAGADKVFEELGGDAAAARAVVKRMEFVPPSVAKMIRGSLISNDPKRVASAATLALEILQDSSNAFTGMDGASEILDTAGEFKSAVLRGKGDVVAAQEIVKENSALPEHKSKARASRKTEDIDALLKKERLDDTLGKFVEKHLNDSVARIGRPDIGWTVEQRNAAVGEFSELVKEKYLQGRGDLDAAKQMALLEFEKSWGASYVGSPRGIRGNAMRFPVEKNKAYAGIPDAADRLANEAVREIKDFTNGQDVKREQIAWVEMPNLETARAYWEGRPAPYQLIWVNKDGKQESVVKTVLPSTIEAWKKDVEDKKITNFTVAREARGGRPPVFGSEAYRQEAAAGMTDAERLIDEARAERARVMGGGAFTEAPSPEPGVRRTVEQRERDALIEKGGGPKVTAPEEPAEPQAAKVLPLERRPLRGSYSDIPVK